MLLENQDQKFDIQSVMLQHPVPQWIIMECLLVVVLALLGDVLAGHMEKPVCVIETLLYQFQCSTRCHSGSAEWQSIPVISVPFPDEYYGEL